MTIKGPEPKVIEDFRREPGRYGHWDCIPTGIISYEDVVVDLSGVPDDELRQAVCAGSPTVRYESPTASFDAYLVEWGGQGDGDRGVVRIWRRRAI